jgi:hypothetical protein
MYSVMRTTWILPAIWFWLMTVGPAVSGAGAFSQKDYDDCIVRHASRGPSPQAALILQRACFYKYRFGKEGIGLAGVSAEQRKLSKIYTPEVCDCVFEKMFESSPQVPAKTILKHCVESSQKAPEPSAQ